MVTRVSSRVDIGLRTMAAKIKDTRQVNRRLSVQLYGLVLRNFQTSGKHGGVPWAPLKPNTLKQKRKKGYSPLPLVRTGALRSSFVPFHDSRVAGVGSELDYATYHEQGTQFLPARPMLPTVAKTREYGVRIYQDFVIDAAKQAGLK